MGKSISSTSTLTMKYVLLHSAFWAAFSTIWSFATVYLLDRGFENTQVGIVMSLGAILSILVQPLIAYFVDRFHNLTLRYVVIFLAILLMLLTVSLWLLPINLITSGCLYALIGAIILSIPSFLNSLALDYMNLGIPINFGLARGLGSISFGLMAYLIGIASVKYSSSIILPIFIVLTFIMMVVLYTFKSPSTYTNTEMLEVVTPVTVNDNDKHKNVFSFFKDYKKFSLLLIGFTMLFVSHNFLNTYHINIMKHVGGNDADMGLSIGIAAALELPTMIAFAYLLTKISCANLLKISALFFLLKAIVIAVAPNVGVVFASQLFQIGAFALFIPASVYYANDIIDKANKVKGQALMGAATMGAGGTLGNFFGGKILDTYNVTTMLVLGIIAAGIGFIITLLCIEKPSAEERRN